MSRTTCGQEDYGFYHGLAEFDIPLKHPCGDVTYFIEVLGGDSRGQKLTRDENTSSRNSKT